MNARNKIRESCESLTTADLLANLADLDGRRTTCTRTGSHSLPDQADRAVYALISDTLETRRNLTETK